MNPVEVLVKLREEARANKDYEFADQIREDLRELGYEVQDINGKTYLRRMSNGR